MLIQKSLELEGTESSFKVDPRTIKSNLMTWFRPKSGDSESNKNYQQSIKNIFLRNQNNISSWRQLQPPYLSLPSFFFSF